MRNSLVALLLLLILPRAHAASIEANVFYFSDSMSYASQASTYNRTLWDIYIGLNLDKKGRLIMGWNYGSMSFTDSPNGTPTKLTISDMGPKVTYYIDKDLRFPLSVTYNIISKGSYSSGGGTALEERGTSMKVEFGYTPQIGENIFFGAKLNWYKASFSEEVSNQTALAKVTNGRTAIYPSLSILYRFN